MNQGDEFRGDRIGRFEDGTFDESFFAGELDERFADWLDGRLGAAECAALEDEMVADADLRRRAHAYRDTVTTVRAHAAGEQPPAELVASVLAQLPGRRGRHVIPLLASLTAAAALVILYFVLEEMTDAPTVVEESVSNLETNVTTGRDADIGRLAKQDGSVGDDGKRLQDSLSGDGSVQNEKSPRPKKVGLPEGSLSVGGKAGRRPSPPPVGASRGGLADGKSAPAKKSAAGAPAEHPTSRKPAGRGAKAGKTTRVIGNDDRDRAKAKAGVSPPVAKQSRPPRPGAPGPSTPGPGAPEPGAKVGLVVAPGASDRLRRLAAFYFAEVKDREEVDSQPARDANKKGQRAVPDGAEKKVEVRRSRQRGGVRNLGAGAAGGRGRRRGVEPQDDTPVLLLSLSSASARRSNLGEKNAKDRKKAAVAPPKGKAPGGGEAKGVAAEAGPGAARRLRQRSAGEADKGVEADPMIGYFETRYAVRDAKTRAASVQRIGPRHGAAGGRGFASKLRTEVGNTPVTDGTDYAFRPGDDVYLVSGDEHQIRQFFLRLKAFLAARPEPPRTAPVKTAESAPKRPSPSIPVVVQQFKAMRAPGLSRPAASGAWSAPQKTGELRFVLVLRH